MVKRLWSQKLVRFFVAGCFNTLFDITLLLVFYKVIGLPELVANTMSISMAITVSYFLNHRIVFRYQKNYSFKNYLKFFAITGFSTIVIQDAVIYVSVHKLWVVGKGTTRLIGLEVSLKTLELLGAKIVGVLIGMVWNFLLYKYLVFRHTKKTDEADEYVIA